MKILTNIARTPTELSIIFILLLFINYLAYHFYIEYYSHSIIMFSSSIVASVFDMNILNTANTLNEIYLVSNNFMYNTQTQQIDNIQFAFTQEDISRLSNIFNKTPLILASILLFVRSFKTLSILALIIVSIHIISVSIVMTDIMLFASLTNLKFINYFQAMGITKVIVDLVEFSALLLRVYVPVFSTLLISYIVWEKYAHSFVVESQKEMRFINILNFSK